VKIIDSTGNTSPEKTIPNILMIIAIRPNFRYCSFIEFIVFIDFFGRSLSKNIPVKPFSEIIDNEWPEQGFGWQIWRDKPYSLLRFSG
jgi:hypothetical protein